MGDEGGFGLPGPEPGKGGALELQLVSQGLLNFASAASKIPLEIPRGPGAPRPIRCFQASASAVHTHLRLR